MGGHSRPQLIRDCEQGATSLAPARDVRRVNHLQHRGSGVWKGVFVRTQFETGPQPAFGNPSHRCHGPLNPGARCQLRRRARLTNCRRAPWPRVRFFFGGGPEPLLLPAGTRSTPRQKEACDAHKEGRPITSRTSLTWCVGDPTSLAPRRDVIGAKPMHQNGSGD